MAMFLAGEKMMQQWSSICGVPGFYTAVLNSTKKPTELSPQAVWWNVAVQRVGQAFHGVYVLSGKL